jgi:LPXTG-motif cell wall-anchored protein
MGTAETIESAPSNAISFNNGTATFTFTLKGGEWAEFSGLPEGTTFLAQEDSKDLDGYETTVSSEGGSVNENKTVSGTTGAGAMVTVSYVNARYRTTVNVLKQNADTRLPLAGATFELRKMKQGENASYEVDTEWPEQSATTKAEDGCRLAFVDLPDGCYRLEETHVPEGYARTGDQYIYFKIAEGAVTWMTDDTYSAEKHEGNQVTYTAAEGGEPATFTVGNTPGVALPATGGRGAAPIYIGGAAMALLALALLLRRRARNYW